MAKARWLVFFVWALFLSCLVKADDQPNDIPDTFKASVGGFLDTSYSVVLGKTGVEYSVSRGGKEIKSVVVHPSRESWEKFWKSMGEVQIFDWAPKYTSKVADGTQWAVTLKWHDKSVQSQGNNNYPKDGHVSEPTDDPQSSPVFSKFCTAASELVGMPFN